MESMAGFAQLVSLIGTVLANYGPIGLVVVVWYFDVRLMRRMLKEHEDHMKEIRRMYESNVRLVDAFTGLTGNYKELAEDLKEVVIMNTQAMTKVCDDINQNQFCPMQRVNKKTVTVGT